MPFEFDDRKIELTLIMIKRRDGSVKYSGMIRIHYESGDTYVQLSAAIDNSMIFNKVEWIDETPVEGTEFALIGYDPDWGVPVV